MAINVTNLDRWPALPLDAWADTYATLHLWTQIVGKIRLALSPRMNHWWEVPLYVTARGLTTSPMPAAGRALEITFDFVDHRLLLETNAGEQRTIELAPQTVARFYERVMGALRDLGIDVRIWPVSVETPSPIRLDRDQEHASYDAEYAHRMWQALVSIDEVFKEFRARFVGKASPVHFFWGSFDLAVTRFSGRRAPERQGADAITREAYSHEVASVGFWPGRPGVIDAVFYAYAAPEPDGFKASRIAPAEAFYDGAMNEFFLKYADVRSASSPRGALLDFMQSTYEASANLAGWNRRELERG